MRLVNHHFWCTIQLKWYTFTNIFFSVIYKHINVSALTNLHFQFSIPFSYFFIVAICQFFMKYWRKKYWKRKWKSKNEICQRTHIDMFVNCRKKDICKSVPFWLNPAPKMVNYHFGVIKNSDEKKSQNSGIIFFVFLNIFSKFFTYQLIFFLRTDIP